MKHWPSPDDQYRPYPSVEPVEIPDATPEQIASPSFQAANDKIDKVIAAQFKRMRKYFAKRKQPTQVREL